jgi:hypothetical protein
MVFSGFANIVKPLTEEARLAVDSISGGSLPNIKGGPV